MTKSKSEAKSKTKSAAEKSHAGKKKHRKRTRYARWLTVSANSGNTAGGRLGDNNIVKLGVYLWSALFVLIAAIIVIVGGSISLHHCSEAAAVNLSVVSGIVLLFVSVLCTYQGSLQAIRLNNLLSALWITPTIGLLVAMTSAAMSLHAMHCKELAYSHKYLDSPTCVALKLKLCNWKDAKNVTTFDDSLSFWGSTFAAAFCLVAMVVGRMVEKIELDRRREAADVKMEIGAAQVDDISKTAGSSEDKSKTLSSAGFIPPSSQVKSQKSKTKSQKSKSKSQKSKSKKSKSKKKEDSKPVEPSP